ncbi:hypothetical protein RchiOBHm_Chr1g0345771 [Rosa chinensis]|uniref:Uncharacterized protein n=1 Tax=Rosa chinensis TaxID=74649 RepID=A0A2P6SEU8_ROSCH|nr:hypothetical protein RchiOBHm_Chr1g0345771 [Rosa chinensis]
MKSMHKMYRNGVGGSGKGSVGGGSGGFRIRILTGISIAQPGNKVYPNMDPKFGLNSHSGPSYTTAKVMRECNYNSGGEVGVGAEVEGKREGERPCGGNGVGD